MKKNTSSKPVAGNRAAKIVFVIVFFLSIAAAVTVFVIVKEIAEVPPLPRASFDLKELQEAILTLEAKGKSITPTSEEEALIGTLEKVHTAELSKEKTAHDLASAYRVQAESIMLSDKDRYLKLGDRQAWKFSVAFTDVLMLMKNKGIKEVLRDRGEAIKKLNLLGGTFLSRALKWNIIDVRGHLDAPSLLPAVLFKRRWRAMVGIRDLEGLTPLEMRVDRDFVVRFSRKSAYKERVRAINALARLDSSYDALVAKAVVLFEGNRIEEALSLLKSSGRAREGDQTVESFIRFLDRNKNFSFSER